MSLPTAASLEVVEQTTKSGSDGDGDGNGNGTNETTTINSNNNNNNNETTTNETAVTTADSNQKKKRDSNRGTQKSLVNYFSIVGDDGIIGLNDTDDPAGDGTMKTAGLRIPILPHTSPEANQPPHMKLPLYKHQLRALNRCLCIETDGSLNEGFGEPKYKYTSRGGVLADQVGVGKTATMIGLVLNDYLNGDSASMGDTLVVTPKHLIMQWKNEITKFTDHIDVVVGKKEYDKHPFNETRASGGVVDFFRPRIVLIDVDTLLNTTEKLWYNFRRVYEASLVQNEHRGLHRLLQEIVDVTPEQLKQYKEAAQFCVTSPKGSYSYEGFIYTSSLYFKASNNPWRRVIFDEIQDLIVDGKESTKNLLQVTRTARNVWLLSATPFPHGNASVSGNHELLGFNRLKLNVEVSKELPKHHIFERIKSKLYIKSPKHVADDVISNNNTVTVERNTEYIIPLDLEQRFYLAEEQQIVVGHPTTATATAVVAESHQNINHKFGECYRALREMTVHPEASKELREVFTTSTNGNSKSYVRSVSTSVQAAVRRAITDAKRQLDELKNEGGSIQTVQLQQHLISRSIQVAEKVDDYRTNTPLVSNIFDGGPTQNDILIRKRNIAKLIHGCYCTCSWDGNITNIAPLCSASKNIVFRRIVAADSNHPNGNGVEFLRGRFALHDLVGYFDVDLAEDKEVARGENGSMTAIKYYLMVTKRLYRQRQDDMQSRIKRMNDLQLRIDTLTASTTITTTTNAAAPVGWLQNPANSNAVGHPVGAMNTKAMEDALASKHGSKPAALIRFLQAIFTPTARNGGAASGSRSDKVIVFSYWHDTLKLIQQALHRNNLQSVFCEGNRMNSALHTFTSDPSTNILLLSAQSKASGANLQCATHVVLLDPAGSSAEHGSALEEQAIGRAVRMGQDRPVTVTRFCVVGTLEEELYKAIDEATDRRLKKAADTTYTIEASDKQAGTIKQAATSKQTGADDVEVTESLTQSERLAKSLKEAEANGDVIDLLDDDSDDDNENKKPPASSNNNILQPITPIVKKEPGVMRSSNPKRMGIDQADVSECLYPSKRICTTQPSLASSESTTNVDTCMESTSHSNNDPTLATSTTTTGAAATTPFRSLVEDRAHTVTPFAREDSLEDISPSESSTNSKASTSSVTTTIPMAAAAVAASQLDYSRKGKEDDIETLLRRLDLLQYKDAFLDSGYDNVPWLYEHAQDMKLMESLCDIVGFKPGHAIRFQTGLVKEANNNSNSNNNDAASSRNNINGASASVDFAII